ncbi:MAG: serine/threonine protein kinase [Archangiaceae bacterium]|nr:serine/threonine protein kinase [Archangiaceae bacterium]
MDSALDSRVTVETFGRYQLLRPLGSDEVSEWFLARTTGPGGFEKLLVLKRLVPSLAGDAAQQERFVREARLSGRLDHPNVVQLFDFGTEGGQPFLSLEHVDGPSLRELLDGAKRAGRRLPVVMVVHLLTQVCDALAYVHELSDAESGAPLGLVHRDVCPENVLVSKAGVAKLGNFALTREAEATRTRTLAGRPAYLAPELTQSGAKYDARADVFSMGVMLCEALTGEVPQGTPSLPGALEGLVLRAMERDRERRCRTALELREALDAWLAKQPPVTTEELVAFVASGGAEGRTRAEPAQVPSPEREDVTETELKRPSLPPVAQAAVPTEPQLSATVSMRNQETRLVAQPAPTRRLPERRESAERRSSRVSWGVFGVACALMAVAAWVVTRPAPPAPEPQPMGVPHAELAPPAAPPPELERPQAPRPALPSALPVAPAAVKSGAARAVKSEVITAPIVTKSLPHLRAPLPNEVVIFATLNNESVPARVYVAGQPVGVTPVFLKRPPGVYPLEVEYPRRPRVKVELTVTAQQNPAFEVMLDTPAELQERQEREEQLKWAPRRSP